MSTNKTMDIQKAIKVIDIVTTAITDGTSNTAYCVNRGTKLPFTLIRKKNN